MDEETNIYELLNIAESYINPNMITKILYKKQELLKKSYEIYKNIINILLYKKEYIRTIKLYPTIINNIVNMEISNKEDFLAQEYYNFANIKYLVNKESSIVTYKCCLTCYEKTNNNTEYSKILLKIINIYEELFNNNKVIKYLIIYNEKNNDINDINNKIKLGDFYILNDNLIEANNIYNDIYKNNNIKDIYIKLLLTNFCLNKDILIQEYNDNNLLYPSLDMFEEIIYIEKIVDIIKNKYRDSLKIIIEETKDNIVAILLNIIYYNLI